MIISELESQERPRHREVCAHLSSQTTLYFSVPLVAVLGATLLLTVLVRWRNILLDRPNERSLHHAPVPRIGGIGIIPAIALAWAMLPGAVSQAIWLPAAFLFALSLLDDTVDIPVLWRLIAHVAAAGYFAAALITPQAGVIAGLAAVLVVAWMTNLYNFMDGSDGLAGGMSVIGFGCYAAGAWFGSDTGFAFTCLAVAAATLPFLYFNFHPARIFMGDSGSIPLGFLAASLGTEGWLRDLWPAWFPLLVFSPFIVDATITLLRRFLRREKVWRAHREHYYQRLVQLGWGHRATAYAEYTLMAICALAALLALQQPPRTQLTVLFACGLLYVGLAVSIDKAWRRHLQET